MFRASALAGAFSLAALAQAPKYPSKPIKFVVPFAAGGGGDTVARLLAHPPHRSAWASRCVVENRIGAGGNIGSDFVLKSPPDGYTLLNMSSTYPIQAAVSKLPFDPDRRPAADHDGVARPGGAAGHARLADHARRRTWWTRRSARRASSPTAPRASARSRTSAWRSSHYVLGIQADARAVQGLVAGLQRPHGRQRGPDAVQRDVQRSLREVGPGARARHRGHAARAPRCPSVPTFDEQGYPGYNVVDWKAIAGPKGMPPDVVAFLNRELNAVLQAERAIARQVRGRRHHRRGRHAGADDADHRAPTSSAGKPSRRKPR